MAVFGVPVAHGNDSERAVRAAWDIQHGLAELGLEFKAQIGIASGQVVVSPAGNAHPWEFTITGEAVRLAAHLAVQAMAGEMLISDAVYRSVSALIIAEPLARERNSEAATSPLWWVRAVHVQGKREEQSLFVGRRNECRQFAGAVEACLEAGSGQTFFIRGEAGIGKTQLAEEFTRIAQEQEFVCHRALVLDFGVGTGQDAIRMLVRSLLEVLPDCPSHQLQEIARGAIAAGLIAADEEMFLDDLLNLPLLPEYKTLYEAMSNAARHRAKQALVSRLIEVTSSQQPVLLVVEDIHWADPVTLAYLARIAAAMNTCSALLVMTSRIEGEPLDPVWRSAMQGAPLTTMDLAPLRPEEALVLAGRLADANTPFARCCVERSGGNPLFLEQLLYAEGASDSQVPDSIQSIVWARLDQLEAEDKQAIQAASVMGQRFSLAALRFVLADPHFSCSRLVEQRLIRADGEDYLFAFREALKLASQELSPYRAWMGIAAGLRIKDCYTEALEALDRAEQLIGPQPQIEQLAQIYHHRGNILFPLGCIEDCLRAHQQALKFATKTSSPLLEACALSGLGDAYYQRGSMITAYGYFDRCVVLCREHGLGRVEVANLAMRGVTHFYRNEMEAALEDNHAAIILAARVGAQREEVLARRNVATVLLHLGDWEAAKQQVEEGLALARDLGAKRFIAGFLHNLGSVLAASGQRLEGEACLQEAYGLICESGTAFLGPWILGSLALVTKDTKKRRWALGEGERLLQENSVSHNFLHFYQNAIEAALVEKDWYGAERYAALLEEYTWLEPLPWSDLFIGRARVLAALGAGVWVSTMGKTLQQLYAEARRANLKAALPALEEALEVIKP